MTKETLYAELDRYLSNGYLEKYYADDNFSIFYFLQKIYIGFAHVKPEDAEDASGDVCGVLLTKAEADVIVRSGACAAIKFLETCEDARFAFSENVFSMCQSGFGRWRLKKQIEKKCYANGNVTAEDFSLPESISKEIGYGIIVGQNDFKSKFVNKYKKHTKILKIVMIIWLVCGFLTLAFMATDDLRKGLDKDKPAEQFDKYASTDVYSYVELDVIAPFAEIRDTMPSVTGGTDTYTATYYLYGNTKNNTYGILRFDDSSDEYSVFSGDDAPKAFDEPICMYGKTGDIPTEVGALAIKLPKESESETSEETSNPGHTITLPDGNEIWIPDQPIAIPEVDGPFKKETTDYSETAVAFLAKQGIAIDYDIDLGTTYIRANAEPEKETSDINKFLQNLSLLLVIVSGFGMFLVIIYGFKASIKEKQIEAINVGAFIPSVLEHMMSDGEQE